MICTGNNYNTNIDQQWNGNPPTIFSEKFFKFRIIFEKEKKERRKKFRSKKSKLKRRKGGEEQRTPIRSTFLLEGLWPILQRSADALLTIPPLPPSLSPPPSPCRRCFAAGRKIECEHGRSICPKESLIFGRCPPTIFVLVENYISPRRTVLSRGARGGGPPHIIIPIGPL